MDLDFFTRNDVPYFNDPAINAKDEMQFINSSNTNVNGSLDLVSSTTWGESLWEFVLMMLSFLCVF